MKNTNHRFSSSAVVFAALAFACSDATNTPVPPPPPPPPPANQAPAATGAIPAQRLSGPGDTTSIDAAGYFNDPDGDQLSFSASSSDASVVRAETSGSIVTLTGESGGVAQVTVRASDPDGESADASFAATVNRSPTVAQEIPDQLLPGPGDTVFLDLSAYFSDPDGDELSFSASTSDSLIVRAQAVGATAALVGGTAPGEAEVTVTARDPDGLEVESAFSAELPEFERLALAALYEATDGENWTNNDGWLTDAPLNEWYGITTWNDRVLYLQLSNNNLTGSIPPEIGYLTEATALNLVGNSLNGPIPHQIGKLSKLLTLFLAENMLSGSIPAELAMLSDLTDLNLSSNELTGQIPPEIGNLDALEYLQVAKNRLSGPIPAELGGLPKLRSLTLDGNDLSGEVPPELGDLATLETLQLNKNSLTGPIPEELGGLTVLTRLWLHENDLSGTIPLVLGSLDELIDLNLNDNGLEGPIPSELGDLPKVEFFNLSNNSLSGSIPKEIGNASSVEFLYLGGNGLTGPVPLELANLASLTSLGLLPNEGLCAPQNEEFVAWLAGLGVTLPACASGLASSSVKR